MRRNTPGVLRAEETIDVRVARAEGHDPDRVIRLLEPLVTEGRRARLVEVIGRRLGSVAAVFDGPYDPHNGAAVVRTCEAFGVQRLHVIERPGTPFAMAHSVARGAEKWIDLVRHAGPATVIAWAQGASMPLIGADATGDLTPDDLRAMPRFALVLGNEREGVREEVARACAGRVRVPMRGFVESLNVSVTAAILLQAATHGRPGDLDEGERRRLYARGLYLSVPHAEDVLGALR
ncbi:MAG TPA: RNA methyltransferase [Polyangiaceae bacterium]